MNPNVSLGLVDPVDGITLVYDLLTKVTNGDKLIIKKLDACIRTTSDNPYSEDFSIVIDHHHLVEDGDPKSLKVLRDLLLFQRNSTVQIFHHPVIVTFIKRRWPKVWFYLTAFIYLMFVLNFTFFSVAMFTPYDDHVYAAGHWLGLVCGDTTDHFMDPDQPCITGQSVRGDEHFEPLHGCDGSDLEMCGFELIFFTCLLLLIAVEGLQAYALGIEYLRELENWLEITIIGLSIFCFSFKTNGRILCIFASLATGLAWIQLMFLFGRFPSGGGLFSLIYISSCKRVLQVITALVLMMVGYAFAFYIIDFGSSETHSILRFQVNSFIQVMGGADFEALWDQSSEVQKYHPETKYLPIRIVTMGFLVTELVFGAVVLVNLIIAIIVVDMEYLTRISHDTALRNEAHHAVQTRVLRRIFKCLFDYMKKSAARDLERAEDQLVTAYCMHKVCTCGRERLDDDLSSKLLDIVKDDRK